MNYYDKYGEYIYCVDRGLRSSVPQGQSELYIAFFLTLPPPASVSFPFTSCNSRPLPRSHMGDDTCISHLLLRREREKGAERAPQRSLLWRIVSRARGDVLSVMANSVLLRLIDTNG